MRRSPAAAVLGFLVALVSAPAANAGDIEVEHVVPRCTGGDECRYFNEPPYDNHTFVARPGEANAIVATRLDSGRVAFRDNARPIVNAANCQRISAHEVHCGSHFATVEAGDMNDVVNVDDRISVLGGSGNDTINGGSGPDALNAGPGDDTVRAGGGRDLITDGHDGAAGDRDVYDGGIEGAEVSYSVSRGIVNADLNDLGATQGEIGEGDRFVGITDLTGGSGDDVLTAVPGGSALYGGPGADALVGGEGDDQMHGGAGENAIDAGGGRDSILPHTDRADGQSVACGDGPDLVTSPASRDLIGADCETVSFSDSPIVRQRLPMRRLTAVVARATDFYCEGSSRPSVELRVARHWRRKGQPRAGTLLGRRAGSRKACRGNPRLSVRLSPRGRRLIRRFGLLPVEVRVNDPGNRSRYVTEIRAPGV